MQFPRRALDRVRALFRTSAIEREMNEELRLHLDLLSREFERKGMSHQDAERAARRQFGNMDRIREQARDVKGAGILAELLQDLHYAVRTIQKNPLFFLVIIVSLALGIGANAAMFSTVNSLYLKAVSVPEPENLVRLKWSGRNRLATRTSEFGYSGNDSRGQALHAGFSYSAYLQFGRANQTLDDLLAFAPIARLSVVVNGQAEVASALLVSGSYFPALGIQASRGRVITPEDDKSGAQPVMMISDAYWRRRFAVDPNVLGKSVTVNNVRTSIIGVTPAGFQGVDHTGDSLPDLIVPLAIDSQLAGGGRLEAENFWWLCIMGKITPGKTTEQVQANFAGVFQDMARRPDAKPDEEAKLYVQDGSRGMYETDPAATRSVQIMAIAVAFILAIVCANVATLLLSRSATRQREMSVRLSLGASRLRLIRQLLTESVLLAMLACGLGVGMAYWFDGLLPETFAQRPALDLRVFAFVALLSIATGILFGLAPALRATTLRLAQRLHESGRTVSRSYSLLSKSLIVIQVSISMVLLIDAGLLVRTLYNLRAVDLGFNARNLLVFRLNPSLNGYDAARTSSIYEQIRQELEILPGVRAVSLSSKRLLSDEYSTTTIALPGQDVVRHEDNQVHMSAIAPNFFATMEIPLLMGRALDSRDNRPDAVKVAIINESAAKKFFAGADPVGRTFRWNTFGKNLKVVQHHFEVVGVAADTRHYAIREAAPPTIYIPYLLLPPSGMTFEVRTSIDPLGVLPLAREAVARVDSTLPVMDPATQIEQAETRYNDERLFAFAFSTLGALAAVLASIGLFGMMSYSVALRTRELGIRLAVGAQRRVVIRMVLSESLHLVFAGIAIGIVTSLASARLVATLLFGLAPADALTLGTVAALMVSISILAAFLPARRASRVDPMIALRYE